MRPHWTALTVSLIALALTAGSAVAQPVPTPIQPNPLIGPVRPQPFLPDGIGMPSPNTGTLTGGGYDVHLGYWVRGGPSDSPTSVWPGPATTPFATPYNLSHPVGTGYYMGPVGNGYYVYPGYSSGHGRHKWHR